MSLTECKFYFIIINFTENSRPTLKDLNRYITRKYATDWYEIGIELGLQPHELDIIENDHNQTVTCFQKTFNNWLKSNTNNATWTTLEVALTNVNRTKSGLDPIECVYGK